MRFSSPNPETEPAARSPIGERAERIVGLTASAWGVATLSPRARARQAPRGYVPARVLRRMRASAGPAGAGLPLLAHSW